MNQIPDQEFTMRIDRLEALADAAIAIVLTVLVLLLEPPTADETSGDMLAYLLEKWHILAAFALSFILIALYWLNHHAIFHYVKQGTLTLLWFNLIFLLTVALIPFPTALLVDAPTHEHSIIIYACAHLLCSLTLVVMWFYITKRPHLTHETLNAERKKRTTHKLIFPPTLYALAIGICLFSRVLSLILFAAIPIYHMLIDRSTLYHTVETRQAG